MKKALAYNNERDTFIVLHLEDGGVPMFVFGPFDYREKAQEYADTSFAALTELHQNDAFLVMKVSEPLI